jgi:hypothetical protein
MLMLGIGIPSAQKLAGGAPAPDYPALMQTLLSGTGGWAIDPSDSATLFTDTAGTIPVVTPGVDTVARINSKFGTTAYSWSNVTPASQSLWNSTFLTFDSADDWYDAASDPFTINAPGLTLTWRGKVASLAGISYLYGTGRGSFGAMYHPIINTDGSIAFGCRRLLADAVTTITSAAGLITAGVAFTLQFIADYAGTGNLTILLNGVSIATGTMAGSAANSENVTPTRSRIGRVPTNTSTSMYSGAAGRIVMARSVLTAPELANCRGYVEDIAI